MMTSKLTFAWLPKTCHLDTNVHFTSMPSDSKQLWKTLKAWRIAQYTS